MIDVDKIDDGLPISVIIPFSKKREDFFYNFTLPLIEANNPKEIIINSNNGSAPKKRNEGFKKSTQPYIFFCDDDILLPANILEKFFHVLKDSPQNIGFAYSGYKGIVLTKHHPIKQNYEIKSQGYNYNDLKRGNYISTMSLLKREYFYPFDEDLERFQDWSQYLYLGEKGIKGTFVDDTQFLAFYLDEGITSPENNEYAAYLKIREKHET